MKRSTALRHVTELVAEADRLAHLPREFDLPLSELWVGGELLAGADQLEWAQVVVRLDIPKDDLPYLALHPAIAAYESFLRLDKRPVIAHWRSRGTPAWDHEVRRVARIWSAGMGPDELLIRHLHNGTVSDTMVEEPTRAQLDAFLTEALPLAERHLAQVLDRYWEPDWRGAHKGFGIHPEHHLWRAAEAVRSLRDARGKFG